MDVIKCFPVPKLARLGILGLVGPSVSTCASAMDSLVVHLVWKATNLTCVGNVTDIMLGHAAPGLHGRNVRLAVCIMQSEIGKYL